MSGKKTILKDLGEHLKSLRINENKSLYNVCKYGKIQRIQAESIESGDKNYTINSFLSYLKSMDIQIILKKKSDSNDDDVIMF